ncbi:hypothetical protein HK104_011202, partial [Borealophlyctis nickersoniae]
MSRPTTYVFILLLLLHTLMMTHAVPQGLSVSQTELQNLAESADATNGQIRSAVDTFSAQAAGVDLNGPAGDAVRNAVGRIQELTNELSNEFDN